MLGLLDDVKDVLFLSDIALECRPTDRRGDDSRGCGIDIGDNDPGGTCAMKCFAHCTADTIATAGNDDDFARHLHGRTPLFMDFYVKTISRMAV
jgi:hypothetical protein